MLLFLIISTVLAASHSTRVIVALEDVFIPFIELSYFLNSGKYFSFLMLFVVSESEENCSMLFPFQTHGVTLLIITF